MIEALSLHNFRNIEHARLSFSADFNVIFGANGSGKTSLFEGIQFAGFGNSPYSSKAADIVKKGMDSCAVFAKGPDGDLAFNISKKGAKKVTLDNKRVGKISDILGLFPQTIIGPQEVQLVVGSPSERRRTLNMHICQIDNEYTEALRIYDSVLSNRNAALKENYGEELILAIDEELVKRAIVLINRRREFIESSLGRAKSLYYEIAGGNFEMRYNPSFEGSYDEYMSALFSKRPRERILGNTTIGPHRDEIDVIVNDKPAREFASWGQKRISSIVMLVAMNEQLHKHRKQKPSVLLDDCFAELDDAKTEKLIMESPNWGQVFIATPKAIPVPDVDVAYFKFTEPGIVTQVDKLF